jgi:hypothetical protein
MSERETRNALLQILNTPRSRRKVPIRCLARAAGLSHMTLYEAVRGKPVSKQTRVKLSPVLEDIANGTLRYRRVGWEWKPIQANTPP